MKTRIWAFVLLIIAALLLSACKIRFGTAVNASGAGDFRVEMGYTAEDTTALEAMGVDTSVDLCESMRTQMESGGTVSQGEYYTEVRGDVTWCGVKLTFASLDELKQNYLDMQIVVNEVSMTDGKFVYDVNMDNTGSEGLDTLPIEMTWELTVPGSVGENNADEVNGNTLTWNLDASGANHLHAESNPTPAWLWWTIGIGLACLCVIVIVAVGIGVFFLVRRRRQSSSPPAPTVE